MTIASYLSLSESACVPRGVCIKSRYPLKERSMYKKAFGFLMFAIASSIAQQMPVQPTAPVADKPRVFITDSQSWETSGSAGGANGAFAAHSSGGARPQTAEIIKTFGEKCSSVMVNNIQ